MSTRPTAGRPRRQERKKRSGTAPDSPFAVFESPAAMLAASRRGHAPGLEGGLVATMGGLHAGHLSLVEAARRENATFGGRTFVEPSQFWPGDELCRCPG